MAKARKVQAGPRTPRKSAEADKVLTWSNSKLTAQSCRLGNIEKRRPRSKPPCQPMPAQSTATLSVSPVLSCAEMRTQPGTAYLVWGRHALVGWTKNTLCGIPTNGSLPCLEGEIGHDTDCQAGFCDEGQFFFFQEARNQGQNQNQNQGPSQPCNEVHVATAPLHPFVTICERSARMPVFAAVFRPNAFDTDSQLPRLAWSVRPQDSRSIVSLTRHDPMDRVMKQINDRLLRIPKPQLIQYIQQPLL